MNDTSCSSLVPDFFFLLFCNTPHPPKSVALRKPQRTPLPSGGYLESRDHGRVRRPQPASSAADG